MSQVNIWQPKQWNLALVNGYVREGYISSSYTFHMVCKHLVCKYLELNEKFKTTTPGSAIIENDGLTIKASSDWCQAIGTIPYFLNTKNSYRWSFIIKSCPLKSSSNNISIGITNESDYVKMHYNADGLKIIQYGLSYLDQTKYGQKKWAQNDIICMEMKNNCLNFKKNDKDLGCAFETIFPTDLTFDKFYCFVYLQENTHIDLIDFQIK